MSRQLLVRLLVPSIVILGVIFLALDRRSTSLKITTVQEPETVPLAAVSTGTATSGKLFKGEKMRKFSGRKFRGHESSAAAFKKEEIVAKDLKCERWSVVTTIFEPSDAVKKQALMNGWCLVVVGDRKGPHSYNINATEKNFIFLTADMQNDMGKVFPLIDTIPWNHFGRKNIGYLYALLYGASVVWDFDDDNILLTESHSFEILPIKPKTSANNTSDAKENGSDTIDVLEPLDYRKLSFNPYPVMGCPSDPCWPRGLPLQDIKFNHSSIIFTESKIPISSIGIIQSLANQDPDVDAIYRLTQPLPFDFPSDGLSMVVPSGSFAPYNAQATLHLQPALWSLVLPVTVHGRVSDIWRGYIAQRLMRLIDIKVVFSPSIVKQTRNVHDYMADFDSENHLYLRSNRLLEQLNEWNPSTAAVNSAEPLCACIEEIWIMMYESGYIEIGDIHLIQSWIASLLTVGYHFPKLAGQAEKDPHPVTEKLEKRVVHVNNTSKGSSKRGKDEKVVKEVKVIDVKEEIEVIDVKEGKDVKDVKDVKDMKEGKDVKDVKDVKEGKDVKDVKDVKEGKDVEDVKGGKDVKEGKDVKDVKDLKEGKDVKNVKDVKDVKDMKEGKDVKDVKDVKEGKDVKDRKDRKNVKDKKDVKGSKDVKEGKDVKDVKDIKRAF